MQRLQAMKCLESAAAEMGVHVFWRGFVNRSRPQAGCSFASGTLLVSIAVTIATGASFVLGYAARGREPSRKMFGSGWHFVQSANLFSTQIIIDTRQHPSYWKVVGSSDSDVSSLYPEVPAPAPSSGLSYPDKLRGETVASITRTLPSLLKDSHLNHFDIVLIKITDRGFPFRWRSTIVVGTGRASTPIELVGLPSLDGFRMPVAGLGIRWEYAAANVLVIFFVLRGVSVVSSACRRAFLKSSGRCTTCAYPVRELIRCPECGTKREGGVAPP